MNTPPCASWLAAVACLMSTESGAPAAPVVPVVAGVPVVERGAQGKVTRTVTFQAEDELTVGADLYERYDAPDTPLVVLLHRAGSSRGEYRDIAPRFCRMGFNCMAVDLRAGATANRVTNVTAQGAALSRHSASYVDALQDVLAALEYARGALAREGKVVVIGSSYSASLALHVAGTRPDLIDGVVAFGPTECFEPYGKPATWIEESARGIRCPVLFTSAPGDAREWEAIYAAVPTDTKVRFLPESGGRSNALALEKDYPDREVYWKALRAFLDEHFPRPGAGRAPGDGANGRAGGAGEAGRDG